MVISEGAINNIMGGMENTAGVRLHSHRHKLKQRFDIIRKLGQGTYGKVQLAINKETGQEVAIKTIKKAKIETEQDLVRIRREIQIMSSVQQPQIIHIYEVFENREKMVLVMEYAAGGELYDYLSERKVLPEEEARRVFRQVASAVYYCHKHKICHRDLKLENILLDLDGNAKIADFGLSNVFDEKHRLDTFCGSPLYASPEIVKGIPYLGPEVDCWSLGVLLYTLVYGSMPFDGSNFRRLVKQITQGDFYEPATPSSASELIRHMLTVKASDRATAGDICAHWWVNKGYKTSCLQEAEMLACQTPVRLDLLLSLAPKHIDSEHMLIQANGEVEMERNEVDRARPPDREEASQPSRSHSVGAVPPDSPTDIEAFVEKKRQERMINDQKKKAKSSSDQIEKDKINESMDTGEKKKKKSSSKKSSSKVKDDESKPKKKKSSKTSTVSENEEALEQDEANSPRERRSTDHEKKKAKVRESSVSRERKPERKRLVKKKDKSEESIPSPKDSSSELTNKEVSEPTKKIHRKSPSVEHKLRTPSPSPKKETIVAPEVQTPKKEEKPTKPVELKTKSPEKNKIDPMDTEKILQETASKIEAVEAAMARESEAAKRTEQLESNERTAGSSPSSKGSISSSKVSSPVRSRTGSDSSTEAGRTSRRQSKIFSKAAIFENSQGSTSPPAQKPRKNSRTGGLNLSDITKKFEEKPKPEKKTRIVTPFKVSDAKRAFENKMDKRTPNTSRGSSFSGESGPTSPTHEDKTSVVSSEVTTLKEKSPEKTSLKITSGQNTTPVHSQEQIISKPKTPEIKSQPPATDQATKSSSRNIAIKLESEESSESESEAEKMLKTLTQKREELEKVKAEKLMKKPDASTPKASDTKPSPRTVQQPTARSSETDDSKFASLPRGFKTRTSPSATPSSSSSTVKERPQMVLKINIITKPNGGQLDGRTSSQRDFPIASPVSRETSRDSVKNSKSNMTPKKVQPSSGFGEPHLQRARRERIIPIMMEQEDDENESEVGSSSSATAPVTNRSRSPSTNRQSRNVSAPTPQSSEPIRKSRRERIIPISVEGEGVITPNADTNKPLFQKPFNQQGFSREKNSGDSLASVSKPPIPSNAKQNARRLQTNNSEGRSMVDRSDSFSSAGEDEEDEDDGFQILTAESLFSTLLSRVRNLTRKMDDTRTDRFRQQFQPDQMMSTGFWPNVGSPLDSRNLAENLSRGSLADEDPFNRFGSNLWNRSLSRDTSGTDSVFSEPGSYRTLPRAGLLGPSLFPASRLSNDPFFDLRRS